VIGTDTAAAAAKRTSRGIRRNVRMKRPKEHGKFGQVYAFRRLWNMRGSYEAYMSPVPIRDRFSDRIRPLQRGLFRGGSLEGPLWRITLPLPQHEKHFPGVTILNGTLEGFLKQPQRHSEDVNKKIPTVP
jgi:hypothetical protein